ncbi:hypothetical protein PIB30_080358 [Stylosanthes scabra]|uniref:Uncharacterized protein n=1 Tax=Stylosanthes scabra TaxID=79078 RepID=A0ABU6YP07_9FABA|nr:hypothetical protein [Stylosanthes scabra]
MAKDKIYCYDQKKTPKRALSQLMLIHAKKLESQLRMDGQNLDADFLFQYIQSHMDDDEGLRMRVKSGVPTWDTTPGYPSWQANRGKGFKAPVITGPEPPMHMFDDPIDYEAEMDFRYEDAFRQLEGKEIMIINNYKRSKVDWSSRFDKATNEMAEQKKKTTLLEEQLTRMKEKYHLMETLLQRRDQALKSYGSEIEVLHQHIRDKNHMLRVNNDLIALLESENAKLQNNVVDFAPTNEKWSKLYTTLE